MKPFEESEMEKFQERTIYADQRKFQIRQLALIVLIMTVALLLNACGGNGAEPTGSDTADTEPRTFTLEELAEFDGQDGRAAYIAVDGVVYDVTDVPAWQGGTHADGQFMAGRDYSEEIKDLSPHGTDVLSQATVVGVLSE